MTQYMRNADLAAILGSIDERSREPWFAVLLGPKIKRFNEQNRLRIESLRKELTSVLDKYVQKDADGKPEMMIKDGRNTFRFNSDEDEKKYEEEYKAIMDKGFDVYL